MSNLTLMFRGEYIGYERDDTWHEKYSEGIKREKACQEIMNVLNSSPYDLHAVEAQTRFYIIRIVNFDEEHRPGRPGLNLLYVVNRETGCIERAYDHLFLEQVLDSLKYIPRWIDRYALTWTVFNPFSQEK